MAQVSHVRLATGDDDFEVLLQEFGAGASQEVVANLRQVVLRDVEARVAEKIEELWRKGRAMLERQQEKHDRESELLSSQVLQCGARTRALEAENAGLRRAIEELARLAALGAGPAAPAARVEASPDTATRAPGQPPGLDAVPLPRVPPFPVLPGSGAVLLSVSLADSLGSHASAAPTQHERVPARDATTPPASPAGDASAGRLVFSFTLRKADSVSLGLNVSHGEDGDGLRVEGIRPDGAVEAWNRLSANGPMAEKAVRAGDKITVVNGISKDPDRMLEECRDCATVKLTIVRGDPPAAATALRAEAATFVPMASPEAERRAEATSTPEATPEAVEKE